jgi:histidinol dehydrogenase
VRCAGAIFVGRASATAFGDYVAGSNHCLPTNGAARFASGLSPRVFRRRVSQVHLDDAVGPLAVAGAALARAEGLPVHAESMEARARQATQKPADDRAKPGHVVENPRP